MRIPLSMVPPKSLYHAFCEFVYAISKPVHPLAQGEQRKLSQVLMTELKDHRELVEYVLNNDPMDFQIAHLWLNRELELHRHAINPSLRNHFTTILDKVMNDGISNQAKDAAKILRGKLVMSNE